MSEADDDDELLSDLLSLDDRLFEPTLEEMRPIDIERARQTGQAARLYLLGYRRAAELLLPQLVARTSEELVFPFLFLWRKHIEVYLERLLELAWEIRGHTGRPSSAHGLVQLWNKLRPFLEPDVSSSVLDAAAQVIADLQDVDPKSAGARYADDETAMGFMESLPKLPHGFDPEHFSAVLTKLSDLFDGLQTTYAQSLITDTDSG